LEILDVSMIFFSNSRVWENFCHLKQFEKDLQSPKMAQGLALLVSACWPMSTVHDTCVVTVRLTSVVAQLPAMDEQTM
jgi:hypothetical protein